MLSIQSLGLLVVACLVLQAAAARRDGSVGAGVGVGPSAPAPTVPDKGNATGGGKHKDSDDGGDGKDYDYDFPTLSFEDCGSTTDLRVVQISSCEVNRDIPCRVPIGEPVEVTVEFESSEADTSHMRHEAFWVLRTINNSVEVTPPRCAGPDCPYEGPDGLAFKATVTVSKRFPEVRGQLFWKVYDKNDETLICFKTPIELYHPETQ